MERILVSACLLGMACRYDGQSKPNEKILHLLQKDSVQLIPVCPEQLGGLATPRIASERRGNCVIMGDGSDVTRQYQKGAEETWKMAQLYGCKKAILKEKSPSCGCGKIYDGSFSKVLIDGNGVTADLLLHHGMEVIGESQIDLESWE